MKKLILSFVLCFLLTESAMSQNLPTAQQVIDNYITALGGKQKLESVKTLSMKTTVNTMGMEMEGVTIKKDNKFKSTQMFMGQEVYVQMFDGNSGYAMQMGQKMDYPVDQIEKMKSAKIMDALEMDASKVTSVEKLQLDGKDYYVLTSPEGKFYFDTNTNLLYQSDTDAAKMTITQYTEVDGIKFVEEMKIEAAGQEVTIKTSDIQINKGVSDEDFK